MKLLYAVAFAFFPLAAPAQTLDPPTLVAVCNDDHCDDSANQGLTISAGDVLSIEAILEKYGVVVMRDTDDELAGVFTSDPESLAVGSINPRRDTPVAEHAILIEDDCGDEPTSGLDTIASQITAPEPQLEKVAEDHDDVITTGPAAKRTPTVAVAESGNDDLANE